MTAMHPLPASAAPGRQWVSPARKPTLAAPWAPPCCTWWLREQRKGRRGREGSPPQQAKRSRRTTGSAWHQLWPPWPWTCSSGWLPRRQRSPCASCMGRSPGLRKSSRQGPPREPPAQRTLSSAARPMPAPACLAWQGPAGALHGRSRGPRQPGPRRLRTWWPVPAQPVPPRGQQHNWLQRLMHSQMGLEGSCWSRLPRSDACPQCSGAFPLSCCPSGHSAPRAALARAPPTSSRPCGEKTLQAGAQRQRRGSPEVCVASQQPCGASPPPCCFPGSATLAIVAAAVLAAAQLPLLRIQLHSFRRPGTTMGRPPGPARCRVQASAPLCAACRLLQGASSGQRYPGSSLPCGPAAWLTVPLSHPQRVTGRHLVSRQPCRTLTTWPKS